MVQTGGNGTLSASTSPGTAGNRPRSTPAVARGPVGVARASPPAAAGGEVEVPRTLAGWQDIWRQLCLHSSTAESDCRRDAAVFTKTLAREQVDELRAEQTGTEKETKRWQNDLWSGLVRVRKRVSVLARNVQFAPEADDVRAMVRAVERELRLYAEQQRLQFDELAVQECSLEDALQSSLVRFEGWCNQPSAVVKPQDAWGTSTSSSVGRRCSPRRTPRRSLSASLLSPADNRGVCAIRAQIEKLDMETEAAGGATGGWANDDHDTFMRSLWKHRKKTGPEFVDEAQQLLPHLSHESFIAHVAWLTSYEERQQTRKQLVDKWKGMRAAAVAAAVDSAPEFSTTEASRKDTIEEKRRRQQARQAEDKQRNARRHQLEEWRRRREEDTKRAEEEQQEKLREDAERLSQQRRQVQEKRQGAVAEFKAQKELQRRQLSEAKEADKRAAAAQRRPSTAQQQRIAKRSASMVEQKGARVQALLVRHAQASERFAPPPRGSAYEHVESRLGTHTEATVERLRADRAEQDAMAAAAAASPLGSRGITPGNFAHQALLRTCRSCPSWRPHFGA
eukprot:TRINITY_DN25649_c0_g1_i2.p1 TRINITY_DN25649_c0_g1~~TRINITY_DN25649_c0_g1_i2.p1  ORF type:complete len:565 (-),score=133.21 TRINITY_DN25649_c0_g1_i2:234-1928(-)